MKKVFDDSLNDLRISKISLPDTIPNAIFFEEFRVISQLFGKMKYENIFEYLLGEYSLRNPVSTLEILIFTAYLSTKIADSKCSLGIGNVGMFCMDAEFQNVRLLKVKSDDLTDEKFVKDLKEILDE